MRQPCKSGFHLTQPHHSPVPVGQGQHLQQSPGKGGMEFGMNKSIFSQLLARAVCGPACLHTFLPLHFQLLVIPEQQRGCFRKPESQGAEKEEKS